MKNKVICLYHHRAHGRSLWHIGSHVPFYRVDVSLRSLALLVIYQILSTSWGCCSVVVMMANS